MKKFVKALVWILILGGLFFGVYTILPEYPHNLVKSVFQPMFDEMAKTRIDQVKNMKNKDLEAIYGQILENNNTRTQAWVYDKDENSEKVTFYGRGAYINIKDVPDHNDYLYTSTSVKFDFIITGKNVKIKAYIEGKEQDDVIRDLMLRQIYTGERQ
ncbi:MAG: hypothetical protein Q4D51_06645 [Eubacteriales bacterium]|nr:hypothetical protein [Eubacteriales bacterium]